MSVPNHPEAGPVRSMTAFARAMQHGPFGQLSVELRSVNSRHLELTLRLPDVLRDLEHSWRERLRQQIGRGKVELTLRLDAGDSLADGVVLDQERARQLLQAAHEIEDLARHVGPVDPVALLRLPGVLRTQEADATALTATAEALLTQALADFLAMRAREGSALTALVEQRLQGVAREVSAVQDRLPGILAHYRERLLERIREARAELAAERVEQEVVLFAQKLDVAEELDRVLAHLAEIRRVLAGGGAIGRRLDFLMQELNREANTLGSKAVTADSAWSSVELKVLIEQMREQIQNIE